eukprot:TRINITY_DN25_c1_g1_i1.p1 TRINITY_DN25_c1_g1~~TRINITY_DN25_c1_g1_i1.p1  ORF type:complete len:305 (-),score=91.61 TRINITY_DN25_c1_g1_i1:89-1003(-)
MLNRTLLLVTLACLLCATMASDYLPAEVAFVNGKYGGTENLAGQSVTVNGTIQALNTADSLKMKMSLVVSIFGQQQSVEALYLQDANTIEIYQIQNGVCQHQKMSGASELHCSEWTNTGSQYMNTCTITVGGQTVTEVTHVKVQNDIMVQYKQDVESQGEKVSTTLTTADFSQTAPAASVFAIPASCSNSKRAQFDADHPFLQVQNLLAGNTEKRGFLKKIGKGIKKAVGGSKCSICKTAVSVIKTQYGGKISAIPGLINRACGNIPVVSALCKTFIGAKATKIGELLNSGDSASEVCSLIKAC